MRLRTYLYITGILLLSQVNGLTAQENYFGHYFIATSAANPAQAGDTRFAQFQVAERLQPMANSELISHTLVSYDQKLINQRSGIGVSLEQNASRFVENHVRLNYSYTLSLFKKYWLKGGVGLSFHSLNTHATGFQYPDQYDNYGFTGLPSQELATIDSEKAFYTGFSAGIVAYNEYTWLSVSADNLNRPSIEIIGDPYRAPLTISAVWGWQIPLDKNKRPRRIFAANGGIEPYSSIGPIAGFYKSGPFHVVTLGVNAFTNPVFWGVNFRYNAVYDHYLARGTASLNFLAGYRVENWCIAYSYDFMISQTATNYRGAHEISLIYYLYTVKSDYKKNKLIPLPNQLMY
ncbi:MAG: PorP/SprF family type IX secretion system membrane protein [Bacteroidales bacterium]|nr:PorP/SprF family type IX secretion system membrane protein [Bacteroidales bacterium]